MEEIYKIGLTNLDGRNFDTAIEALESSTGNVSTFPLEIFSNFRGFKIKNSSEALVIFSETSIPMPNGNKVSTKQLVTFYGKNIPLEAVKKALQAAIDGKLNNVKEGGYQNDDYEAGSDNGLPIPFLGDGLDLFPFPKIPSIIFLVGAAYSALKFIDTNNPAYVGLGTYSFIHYLKNKK
jgi:hypothetical protein